MNNPVIRFGMVHVLAWVFALPLLALVLRDKEDAVSAAMAGVLALAYGLMAFTLTPRLAFRWLAERGISAKVARLVILSVGLMGFGVAVSYPFRPGVYWPLLISISVAGMCWLAAIAQALFSKPETSEGF